MKVSAKQATIEEAKKNYGYFALISNEIKGPGDAIHIYRNKDLVEKAFGNLKDCLSMRRLLVSSERPRWYGTAVISRLLSAEQASNFAAAWTTRAWSRFGQIN